MRQNDDSDGQPIHEALGQSEAFLEFQEQLSRVAGVNRPVLLLGERGTGKELAATRIHYLSARWERPLVALNCSALSPSLIESELFGHEAGAFTGAVGRRMGRFESANRGTLFLDEIGNIPLEVQEKILRVVEYGTFERVGSTVATQADVRIVGATNVDIRSLTDTRRFMPDLLDRLSFDVLVVPPLRERGEDIPLLANHFASRMAFELHWSELPEITEEAMGSLYGYSWPGNIRELKNVIERAVYRSDDALITQEELIFDPFHTFSREATSSSGKSGVGPDRQGADDPASSFNESVRELECRLLRQGLVKAQFNQRRAADALGLTYHQFRGLYRKYRDTLDR